MTEGTTGTSGSFDEGPHALWPQVTYNGGPIISSPEIVNITYDGFPYQSQVDAWAEWVSTSEWLSQVGEEYGVGVTQVPVKTIHLTDTPPQSITDTGIQEWLGEEIANPFSPIPGPNPNTIYFIYYPQGTAVTNLFGMQSCEVFDGYHNAFTYPTTAGYVTYAVIDDCGAGDIRRAAHARGDGFARAARGGDRPQHHRQRGLPDQRPDQPLVRL